ncbi:hypothetical protein Pelo_18384 [Pelomyxa schiedti]|nr:hypothetical protein Pelo_18384 [Pelomyxa schiedti]
MLVIDLVALITVIVVVVVPTKAAFKANGYYINSSNKLIHVDDLENPLGTDICTVSASYPLITAGGFRNYDTSIMYALCYGDPTTLFSINTTSVMYMSGFDMLANDYLYSLNLVTGRAEWVLQWPTMDIQDIAWTSTGLYGYSGSGTLSKIPTTVGAPTAVGSTTPTALGDGVPRLGMSLEPTTGSLIAIGVQGSQHGSAAACFQCPCACGHSGKCCWW